MTTLTDDEFGPVTIRRSARARSINLRIRPDGHLEATMPRIAPLFLVKRLINSSRRSIRKHITLQPSVIYHDGMQIGKSHRIETRNGSVLRSHISGQKIIIELPKNQSLSSPSVQELLRPSIVKALRKEAKSYLPRRLDYFANLHGFHYQKVRFSHARSRWGSCSSKGTISLNIALMQLPFKLVDYVLIHELCHTREMNHSQRFWEQVERYDPDFRVHRKVLKQENPFRL